MIEELEEKFTKYELARILGARALQLAMDAPYLLNIDEAELDRMDYNPLKIAEEELEKGVLPITVKRPLPKKLEGALKKEKKEEKKEPSLEIKEEKVEDKKIEVEEEREEEEIKEEGEIMELAKPEDEVEEENVSEEPSM